jgi:hypothetical protein
LSEKYRGKPGHTGKENREMELLTIADAADYLRVSVDSVRLLVKRGAIIYTEINFH